MKVKKILKWIGLSLIAALVVLAILYWQLIGYGWLQLKGQLRVIQQAIPLEEFMALPTTTDAEREKAQIILEAKAFAFEQLGINYSENYSTIYDQQGKPSMYVVTACDPYFFKPRMWHFPVVGSVPYKGFFDLEKARAEATKIKENENLEVDIRTAGGWSTLGWFKDPVLSNMLRRSEGDLASLIIHELTHGTLFVKDSVTFNENLASFIGDKGAILFLEQKYGKNARQVEEFKQSLNDELIFKDYMLRAAQHLDSVYRAIKNEPIETKEQLKREALTKIRGNYDTLTFQSDRYAGYFNDFVPKNTFFMSMLRYNSQQELLEQQLQQEFNGDLLAYLTYLKKRFPSL
ncbi:aminopeptidase [Roseivirga thermotolerans]|uniref:aminopeptidase n=1 Tax=Roseivirga thermotolerans TaxID=1758176 RepID=UPI00273D75C0|nr:aminopeptidase [Roseivirga thermotolerans]